MDAGMQLMRLRYMKNPELFRSPRICFLDTMLHMLWTRKYPAFKASAPNEFGAGKLLPLKAWSYFTGEEPKYCRSDKTWVKDIDHIYLLLHIIDNHWVGAWISFPDRHITIWDSHLMHAKDRDIANAVEPVAVMMAHLLVDVASIGTIEPFTHERVRVGVPQSKGGGDCGVYALKFMEFHALGLPFPNELCDANMKAIRAKLAGEIFDETNLHGKDDPNKWDALDLYDSN